MGEDQQEIIDKWAEISQHQLDRVFGKNVLARLETWVPGGSMCGIAFQYLDVLAGQNETAIYAATDTDIDASTVDCNLPEGVSATTHLKLCFLKMHDLRSRQRMSQDGKLNWVQGFSIKADKTLSRKSCANYVVGKKREMSDPHYEELFTYVRTQQGFEDLKRDDGREPFDPAKAKQILAKERRSNDVPWTTIENQSDRTITVIIWGPGAGLFGNALCVHWTEDVTPGHQFIEKSTPRTIQVWVHGGPQIPNTHHGDGNWYTIVGAKGKYGLNTIQKNKESTTWF